MVHAPLHPHCGAYHKVLLPPSCKHELVAFLQDDGGTPLEGAPLNFSLKRLGIPYIDLELTI